MANDLKGIEMLLQQQQEFTKNLLTQQQQWMQAIMNSNTVASKESKHTPDQLMVPAFHKFCKEQQQWDSYLQQLEQHFLAYSVTSAEKQKSFFLSWCGAELFDLLKNLFGVASLENQTYQQLHEKLTEHFTVSQHTVAARYEFFKRQMKNTQSYKEWVADLRGLARTCKFVCNSNPCATSYVDDMIRDHIIVNTPHDSVRTAALQKQQATLTDVLLIAESFEATTKTVAALKETANEKTIEINVVKKKSSFAKRDNKENKYKSCSGCFSSHKREDCKFKSAICNKCGRKGHIAPVCMSKSVNSSKTEQNQNRKQKQKNNIDAIETIYDITGEVKAKNSKSFIDVEINNKIISFQMDSGASISIINLPTFKYLNKPKLVKTNRILYGFGRKEIPILGELHTSVKCGNREKEVVLIVVNVNAGDNLFGYDLFNAFGFQIKQINTISENETSKVDELCEKYCEIFQPALGTVKNFKANIRLKPDAQPKFFRSRPIPFAQMPQFKTEIDRLIEQKIIKPIKFSDWASPIVLARKPNNCIRICGDFKVAVNAQIDIEQYPLPTRDNLFHSIRNGKYFSKIDLKDAYLQMELDDSSKEVMVINTPLGLFQYQRLPYGIASAPAIFQRYIEQLLQGIECCANYLDDIIIAAPTLPEHLRRLDQVLKILKDNGIRCKKEKCAFLQNQITYLGRRISSEGILPDESGVLAVKNLKPPKDIKQLEAFMGKVNYYHNFVPNFANVAAPINMLRRKDVPFRWGKSQQKSFDELKSQIVNATQLAHFQENLPLVLATDASPFGIGAVISHLYPDGTERPIAFASKTLDKHQVKYSQIDKEGLAIVFGVKRFHQFLYGHKFILITDHKPLVSIFNPNKHLPSMTAQRIQRWAITLMAYQFEIKYRKTSDHGNADALSRLPLGPDDGFDKEEDSCLEISFDDFPVNTTLIQKHARTDKTLRQVYHFVKNGWPEQLPAGQTNLKPFFNRRDNMTIYNDLLCLQTDYIRVVIPEALKQQTLKLLHDGHWGIIKMKQLARQYIWWNNIDADISKIASDCETCKVQNQSPSRQYESWPKSTKPWERIHIDFAGPIFNSMWLICVDSFSQFPYVSSMAKTTTEDTISALSAIFSIEGIPNTMVSDNGPQLTSEDFDQFCTKLGIKHITTTPFHPASNGLAERFVRTFKTSVRKNIDDDMPIKNAVQKFLSTYRFMPNSEGTSPAELMRGRPVRTIWSQLLEPSEKPHRNCSKSTKYQVNDNVFIRNYGKGKKWIPGVIQTKVGNIIFLVNTNKGVYRRHVNQMKPRSSPNINLDFAEENGDNLYFPSYVDTSPSTSQTSTSPPTSVTSPTTTVTYPTTSPRNPADSNVSQQDHQLRRTTRSRREVSRYEPADFRRH